MRLVQAPSYLEIKARDPMPGRTLAAARALGAHDRGAVDQRDIFFSVPTGCLRLREQSDAAELIESQGRAPGQGPRLHRRLPVDDPKATKALLADELGLLAVVEKRRRLLVRGPVRIHLDRVEGLGSFVELASLVEPGPSPALQVARLNGLRRRLAIGDDQLVDDSYLGLLAA